MDSLRGPFVEDSRLIRGNKLEECRSHIDLDVDIDLGLDMEMET